MAGIPKKVKAVIFPPVSTRVMAMVAFVLEILGLVCLVIGIISDVRMVSDYTSGPIWMEPGAWFFTAMALFIYGLWWWLTAYFAAKEG